MSSLTLDQRRLRTQLQASKQAPITEVQCRYTPSAICHQTRPPKEINAPEVFTRARVEAKAKGSRRAARAKRRVSASLHSQAMSAAKNAQVTAETNCTARMLEEMVRTAGENPSSIDVDGWEGN